MKLRINQALSIITIALSCSTISWGMEKPENKPAVKKVLEQNDWLSKLVRKAIDKPKKPQPETESYESLSSHDSSEQDQDSSEESTSTNAPAPSTPFDYIEDQNYILKTKISHVNNPDANPNDLVREYILVPEKPALSFMDLEGMQAQNEKTDSQKKKSGMMENFRKMSLSARNLSTAENEKEVKKSKRLSQLVREKKARELSNRRRTSSIVRGNLDERN